MPAVRRETLLGLYAAFAGLVAVFYFVNFPIIHFWTRLAQLFLAGGLLLLWAGLGRRLLRFAPVRARLPVAQLNLETFLFSTAVGGVAFMAALFAAGTAGFFARGPFLLVTLGLVLLAGREMLAWAGWIFYATQQPETRPAATALALVVLTIGLLGAFAPPTYYDSLVYHLALPSTYLQEGRISFVPYNQYAHFPQNMELVFGWFLAMGSDVAAQVGNVGLAVLTGLAVWVLGPSQSLGLPGPTPSFGTVGGSKGAEAPRGPSAAIAGRSHWPLVLFLTAPCLLLLSVETYVETPMAFWTTMAVLAAARGVEQDQRGWFALAGLFGGCAAGIKYTGVLTPAILAALVLVWPRRRGLSQRFWDAAAIGGISFLVFLPWMVKNFIFTGGNPVFPFLPRLFPAANVYMFKEASDAYFEVLSEYKGSSAVLELFALPFRLATDVMRFGGGFDVTGDLGWALPLLLLPLAFLQRNNGRRYGFVTAYLVAHVALWASMRPVLRFLFPVFPLLCWVAGEGLAGVLSWFRGWARGIAVALVTLFALSNGVAFYFAQEPRAAFTAALGIYSRDEYLQRKLDYYPAMRAMEALPENSRVLFFGDQRAYYCPRRHVAPMAMLPQPLHAWSDQAATPEALREKLVSEGFTHLFFHRRESKRLESYRVLDFTDHGRKIFDGMLALIPPLADERGADGWGIYRLAP